MGAHNYEERASLPRLRNRGDLASAPLIQALEESVCLALPEIEGPEEVPQMSTDVYI